MERIKRLHAAHRQVQREADSLANERAIEIAREVAARGRGAESEIARELGISQPAVSYAAKRGRALIAELEEAEGGNDIDEDCLTAA